jgi:hypothetical protein
MVCHPHSLILDIGSRVQCSGCVISTRVQYSGCLDYATVLYNHARVDKSKIVCITVHYINITLRHSG